MTKPYKTKFKRNLLEALQAYIEQLLDQGSNQDDDRLLLSVLAEIHRRIAIKLYTPQHEYQVSFTPAQAMALRLLYIDYICQPESYLGNKMHMVANEVHKQFSKQ